MAASTSISAPRTASQPSRKNKKAWRKNVDISEVTTGLATARDEIILTGGHLLADVPSDTLFQTDSAGSSAILQEIKKAGLKPLKADEIIARRSKLPAVDTRVRSGSKLTDGVLENIGEKRKRGNGISHRELERLKRIAYGGDAATEDAAQDQLLNGSNASYDPWAVAIPAPRDPKWYLEAAKPVRESRTLKDAPKPLTLTTKAVPSVAVPDAGRSYNPSFPAWQALLEREGEKEVAAEKKRLSKASFEQERAERAQATAIAVEAEEKENEERQALSEYEESEWEGIQSDVEKSQLKAKRPTRKSPAERNKVTRRKVADAKHRHEEYIRRRDEQTKRLEAIVKAVEETGDLTEEWAGIESDADEEMDEPALARRAFRKKIVPSTDLEVVLPDELQDSLRKLKPEGNLLRDRYRTAIMQGKMEARKRASQRKQSMTKPTTKWSYKDWRVPSRVS